MNGLCRPVPSSPSHHARHRPVAAVRGRAVLRPCVAARILFRIEMGAADTHSRGAGHRWRCLRRHSGVHRHASDLGHRNAGRHSHRPLLGDLPHRIRPPEIQGGGQACARTFGRHSDRGLRLLCRSRGCACDAHLRRNDRRADRSKQRFGCRRRHGHHDHPLRLVPVGRRIAAVPRSMRDGSYAMGATKGETITKVLLPAALPGIMGGILLAVSRAIGETMIVVMAAGIIASLTANPGSSHHGNRTDRHAAHRRYRVRQSEDTGCLRARPCPVSGDARAQRVRSAHRAQIPRKI